MKVLQIMIAGVVLMWAVAQAQQSTGGTVNSLSTNPRQNAELTGTTGTPSGPPDDATPGSENMPNGLVPQTTEMEGSGSNGSMNQPVAAAPSARNGSSAKPATRQKTSSGKGAGTQQQPSNKRQQ